jgi:quercetin 2,3-dioxygenase
LASAAAIALQKAGAQQQRKAVRVSAKEDRNGERIALGPNPNHCKISGKDSAGAISSFEATSLVKGGPPLHIHLDQDEWFYIVSGEYRFRVGNEEFLLKAGDSLFAPRQVPHTFAFVGDAPGRMLCTFQPAGDMEAFFRELGKISGPPAAEQMATLFAKHGMRVVGPPLPVA